MDESLSGHLVNERDGVPQRVLQLGGIAAVDRGADVTKCAAKTRAELAVVFPAANVLPVRFERGFVAGHLIKTFR